MNCHTVCPTQTKLGLSYTDVSENNNLNNVASELKQGYKNKMPLYI